MGGPNMFQVCLKVEILVTYKYSEISKNYNNPSHKIKELGKKQKEHRL